MILNVQLYLRKIKEFQRNILDFIANEGDLEDNFSDLKLKLDEYKIPYNQNDLKLILRFLLIISNNHNRSPNFFFKIEKIILYFQKEIKEYFSSKEIFNIFKENKRILLFCIKNELIVIDLNIATSFFQRKFFQLNSNLLSQN